MVSVASHVDILSALTIWLKMVPKRVKMALFCSFGCGTAGIDARRHKTCWDYSPGAELCTNVHCFLKVSPTGQVLWPSL